MTMGMSLRWIAILSLYPYFCHAAYQLELEANHASHCFAIHTPQDEKAVISGDYGIEEEEDEMVNVHVWIEDSDHHDAWRARPGMLEDQFSFTAPPNKRYLLCFETDRNDHLDPDTMIGAGFNLRVHPLPRSLEADEVGPDAQRALDLVESSLEIEDYWESMLDHFDYLRKRESVHREISSGIMSRVLRWTLIEAGLVVTMATLQVMYWKKFFEQRRYL